VAVTSITPRDSARGGGEGLGGRLALDLERDGDGGDAGDLAFEMMWAMAKPRCVDSARISRASS
jgi:hypothetical protein